MSSSATTSNDDIDIVDDLRQHPVTIAQEAADEIVLLRHVVRILAGELSPPSDWAWMRGSPADEAYYRALNSGSTTPPPDAQ